MEPGAGVCVASCMSADPQSRPSRRPSRTIRTIAAMAAWAGAAGAAWAAPGPLRPPTAGDLASPPTVMTLLVTGLLLGLVLLAALLPAKRGHQD